MNSSEIVGSTDDDSGAILGRKISVVVGAAVKSEQDAGYIEIALRETFCVLCGAWVIKSEMELGQIDAGRPDSRCAP